MEELLSQIFAGLSSGAIYACLALSLVLIYRSTGIVNFAQGELSVLSAFIALYLIGLGLSYWIVFGIVILLAFMINAIVYGVLIYPIKDKSELTILTVLIGLLIVINSLNGLIFGYNVKAFPSPFSHTGVLVSGLISPHQLGTLVVVGSVSVIIYGVFRYTKVGLLMRGSTSNELSAKLLGVNTNAVALIGWGFAGAISAVAGLMIAPQIYLEPNMMLGVLIYALAAALVGGIDSAFGAIAGGFLIGILENLLGSYVVGTELKLTVALVAMVGVLLVRPRGLFGRVNVRKV